MEKKDIRSMNRNDIKQYLLSIQDFFKQSLDKGNDIDFILDNTTILDDFEDYLPEEEYPIFVITMLNGFKSDKIISTLVDKIEYKRQLND
ncbi:MAG: hypothetical protein CMG00_01680 [Candidatus Marinimicrobia bacterium]|nr:hypothetical protein [Candidatus Neomarinimicrobiota bacterium]